MDRRDEEACLHQRIDEEAARPLDGDRRLAGRAVPVETDNEIGKTVSIMVDSEAIENLAGSVDDTNGMARSAPIETDENGHECTPANWSMIPSAGSPRGVLINRRSGRILAEVPVARLPVARLELPAAATPQVSCGPSKGERPRRSSRRRGTNAPSATKLIQRRKGEVD
jgi:hypothetical protein